MDFFSGRYRAFIHGLQLFLVVTVLILSAVRLLTQPKGAPRTRANTMALGMSAKSLVILLYEILTEHVRSLKRYGSLKAYAILNALEIVFWGAVVFLMIQANIKYCVGTNCALSWVVVVLGIILNMLASYMAVCTKWKKDQGTSHVVQVNTNITRAQIDTAGKDRHTTAHVHRRQIQTIGGLTTDMAKREDRLRPTTIVHIKHHAPLRLHIHLHIDTHTL
ncbi:hypothetical protein FDECE_2074 [Fusarium decemcellulare]|nr:hypothetical protein FDECE_2074 [Fusarium decemcellulare]